MVYRAIGLMSGSSLKGLDMAYVHLQETGGKWTYEIVQADCLQYSDAWTKKLNSAIHLNALDYQLLHTSYGHYIGEAVNRFIEDHHLHHQVHLLASHGHTSFHLPLQQLTAQLGDGAAIAAVTGLPVVSDLRALDIAFGGQGTPLVPMAEKLLLPAYRLFLDLGSVATLSFNQPDNYISFDICPANRVLNLLAQQTGNAFDDEGKLAATGTIHTDLLNALNELTYYQQAFPKSLAGDFVAGTLYPLLQRYQLAPADALCTFVEHIATQVGKAVINTIPAAGDEPSAMPLGKETLLVTGGGAFNHFLVERIRQHLQPYSIETGVPDKQLVQYKDALAMALVGVLRWREEYNVLAAATGASRNSVNGALWLGGEA